MRLSPALIVIAFVFIGIACKKDNTNDEAALYGDWIKGTNYGDTLQFMKKNNRNIMRMNMSFNPLLQAYTESEYRLKNGKLEIKRFAPMSEEFYPIDSFAWTEAGREFKIQGIQLYMFLASTGVHFTFRKI